MSTFKQLLQAVAYLFILLAAVITLANLQGCTLSEKAVIYKEVSSKFAVPDKVEACYRRHGDYIYGSEVRCFGDDCEVPPVNCNREGG